ncbi:MAG: PAS domain-containing protein, partial [Sulfurovum sp.]|nr:PAS domain-containing protein [Sulfurovum sp.]
MITTFDMFMETEVPEDELIVSRTDFTGKITYVNETFAEISGYEPEELIGQPHNMIRHPDMPRSAFADLWATVERGDVWEGYVKNRRK